MLRRVRSGERILGRISGGGRTRADGHHYAAARVYREAIFHGTLSRGPSGAVGQVVTGYRCAIAPMILFAQLMLAVSLVAGGSTAWWTWTVHSRRPSRAVPATRG